ncbi:MAG: pantetheine-phosphate adenylyltransferase [Planctomycetota bacterium]
MDQQVRLAVFPGTFDPITNGHVDIIQRGAKLFDRLIVAVGENPAKRSMLPHDTRVDIVRQVAEEMENVSVQGFSGLTVDFAREVGATAILRGIRNSSDLQFESRVALTNRFVAGVETLFVLTSSEWAFTSSSLIRQVAQMGGDVSELVPPAVLPHIRRQVGNAETDHGLHESE